MSDGPLIACNPAVFVVPPLWRHDCIGAPPSRDLAINALDHSPRITAATTVSAALRNYSVRTDLPLTIDSNRTNTLCSLVKRCPASEERIPGDRAAVLRLSNAHSNVSRTRGLINYAYRDADQQKDLHQGPPFTSNCGQTLPLLYMIGKKSQPPSIARQFPTSPAPHHPWKTDGRTLGECG